ncbi:MAG: large subunit ribosomal protein L10 [bacterium]|jgi:large subunit ribosomal protein L10
MNRSTKEVLVSEFKEIFESSVTGVLVDYQGLTVEELTTLRKALFTGQSRMRILKNTLAKRAAEGTPFESLSEQFVSTKAFVYSSEDVVAPSKILTEQAKKNDRVKIVGGTLVSKGTGELLDLDGVKALGSLPSREELVAKLLYVLNAPVTNFVRTLNEIPASFVRVVQAVADSKQ